MYRPQISKTHLMSLYALKQKTGKPITQLVKEAIDDYLIKCEQELITERISEGVRVENEKPIF